ncbi:hypothetical protein B0H14DRAFT_3611925, partial [Mycena olivaceomarginata]
RRYSLYPLTDFGLSRSYKPGERTISGGDRTARRLLPWESWRQMISRARCRFKFLSLHPGLGYHQSKIVFEFIRLLITDVHTDPSQRQNMDDLVLQRFGEIVRGLSSWNLRTPRVIEEVDVSACILLSPALAPPYQADCKKGPFDY